MQFRINFTDNITLTYNLVDHEIVKSWSTLISERDINDCCDINHYFGHYDPELLTKRLNRLFELVDIINEEVPNKIQKIIFDKDNFYTALNTMHVHFPELEQKEEYRHMQKYFSEYNDIIHWLEPALIDYYNNITDNRKFSIKLDFNKVYPPIPKYEIPQSAYKLFNGYFKFGQLMLHYVHVGRHTWELFFANDLICPKEQYVPQSLFTATVRLHFYDNIVDKEENRNAFRKKWEDFYKARGGKEFFGCDIDDPSIRFGYCQIGELSSVNIDSKDILITDETIPSIRNRLTKTKIINWEII